MPRQAPGGKSRPRVQYCSCMSTTPPPRRGRPGHDREAVLHAAIAVFTEQGYEAASVSGIAARLGLTKSALYHHFSSKEELLRIALDTALSGLEGVLDAAEHAHPAASARLEHVVRGAVAVLIAEQPSVTLLLRLRGNSPAERAALERRRVFDQRVTALVRQAQEEGSIRADIDPAVATRLVFGMINSLVEWYRPGGREDAERLAGDVLAVALDGLLAR